MNKSDFKFWDGHRSKEHYENDEYTDSSPPLWTEGSGNLRYHYQYSFPSTESRVKAIEDGRRELMEMIKDIPESSYELSFKDILEDQQRIEREKEKTTAKEMKQRFKPRDGNGERCKNTRQGRISRSESMESGVFLLKMFLPVSVGSKKSKKRICDNVCIELSSKGSSKQDNHKEWWKTMFFATQDNNKKRANIKRCTSDLSSSRNRLVKSDTGRDWCSLKGKSCILPGCLFNFK